MPRRAGERGRAGRVVRMVVRHEHRADPAGDARDLVEVRGDRRDPGRSRPTGSSPTTHVFVPSSVYTVGFGASTRTMRSIRHSSQNTEDGRRSTSSSSGSRVSNRRARTSATVRALREVQHREVGRPVELAVALLPVGEQRPRHLTHHACAASRAVGRGLEPLRRRHREVPGVEPHRAPPRVRSSARPRGAEPDGRRRVAAAQGSRCAAGASPSAVRARPASSDELAHARRAGGSSADAEPPTARAPRRRRRPRRPGTPRSPGGTGSTASAPGRAPRARRRRGGRRSPTRP